MKGFFIVWHRYFVSVYENALRNECGYTGAQPYWNTANDVAINRDPNRWSLFSNDTGFGGNGVYVPLTEPFPLNVSERVGGGCVPCGPFGESSTFKVNIGTNADVSKSNPTCLKRDFLPSFIGWGTQSQVDFVLNQSNFAAFALQLEGFPFTTSIHSIGHFGIGGVGGQVTNPFTSPAGK